MKPLTKSLHTVTATVNVAAHLRFIQIERSRSGSLLPTAADLCADALSVLGYGAEYPADDATVAMIRKQLVKMGLAS